MKIKLHKHWYRGTLSEKECRRIRRKIKAGIPDRSLYLITLPLGADGMLEVYWYPELFQSYYRRQKRKLVVVGAAKDREGAFEQIRQMIEQIGVVNGRIPLKEYFGESE